LIERKIRREPRYSPPAVKVPNDKIVHTYSEKEKMNTKKALISIVLLAVLALSASASLTSANLPTSFQIGGSSTVQPVASDASATFPDYYHTTLGFPTLPPMTVATGQSSGNAFTNVYTAGYDLGELSRPPTNTEWTTRANCQVWAIGIDSVAIIVADDSPLAPYFNNLDVTTVAKIFCQDKTSGNPFYTTWDQVFPGHSELAGHSITRIVRETSSGTYDCFQNFFLKPADKTFHLNIDAGTSGKYEVALAPKTTASTNDEVYNYITGTGGDYSVAFIGMGFLTRGGLQAAAIQNTADGYYYAPTKANVLANLYQPWRFLWQLTNGVPTTSTTNFDNARALFVSYCRLPNPANHAYQGSTTSNYIDQEGYINIPRDDFAGGPCLKDDLTTIVPPAGCTSGFPDNTVGPQDLFYFATAYGAAAGTLNPYADMNADGSVGPLDTFIFAANY
jgi:ABC-type phosphate transport system substrate-binding protein